MTARRPLVVISGVTQELPASDSVAGVETVATGTDYTAMRVRNIKLMTTIPIAADFDGNGSIIGVYTP